MAIIAQRGIVNNIIGAFFIKEHQEKEKNNEKRKVPVAMVEFDDDQDNNNSNANDGNNKINNLNNDEKKKENKIKYLLDIYADNNEIIKINEKLMKNQNERRNKKRKKKKDKNTVNKPETKYGRKNHKDNSIRILSHDKFYQDNIIDKIKNMLNKEKQECQ